MGSWGRNQEPSPRLHQCALQSDEEQGKTRHGWVSCHGFALLYALRGNEKQRSSHHDLALKHACRRDKEQRVSCRGFELLRAFRGYEEQQVSYHGFALQHALQGDKEHWVSYHGPSSTPPEEMNNEGSLASTPSEKNNGSLTTMAKLGVSTLPDGPGAAHQNFNACTGGSALHSSTSPEEMKNNQYASRGPSEETKNKGSSTMALHSSTPPEEMENKGSLAMALRSCPPRKCASSKLYGSVSAGAARWHRHTCDSLVSLASMARGIVQIRESLAIACQLVQIPWVTIHTRSFSM